MTLTQLRGLLESSGLPVAYRDFPEQAAPQLPYLCYVEHQQEAFYADGEAYWTALLPQVALYCQHRDLALEQRLEALLAPYITDKQEQYLEDEACYELLYSLQIS